MTGREVPARRLESASILLIVGAAVAAGAGFVIAASIIGIGIETDLQGHARIAREAHVAGVWVTEIGPLFFGAVRLMTGASQDLGTVRWAVAILVGAAVGAKYFFSYRFAWNRLERAGPPTSSPMIVAVSILVLLFAFSLPVSQWTGWLYLGQFPPNVWHNTTAIVVMPFAVLLFWQSYRSLDDPTWARLGLVVVLALLNLGVKGSLVVPFVVVFPILGFARHRWSPAFRRIAAASGVVGLLLLVQALLVFRSGSADFAAQVFGASDGGGLAVDPFHVWSRYSDAIPISLLASVAFPLVVTVLFRQELRSRGAVAYAWFLVGTGTVVYALFTETGWREFHANLSWQVIIAVYLLFLVSLTALLRSERGLGDWRMRTAIVVFGLHVATGGWYLTRMFLERTYF